MIEENTVAAKPTASPRGGVRDIDIRLIDWHEQVQPPRLAALMDSVLDLGVLCPVHVSPRGGRFMVLDGAHRSRAAQALGKRSLVCREVELTEDAPVDGWTHHIQASLPIGGSRWDNDGEATPREGGKGSVVAVVSDFNGTRELRAPLRNDRSYFEAVHALSRMYRQLPYKRLESWGAAPRVGTEIRWVMPTWGVICHLVEDYGLLPAGVSRLGTYLH